MTTAAVQARVAERVLIRVTEAQAPPARVIRRFRKDVDRLEKAFAQDLLKVFNESGRIVAKAAQRAGGLILERETSESARGDLFWEAGGGLSDNARKRVEHIVRESGVDAWLTSKVKPILGRHWKLTAGATTNTLERYDISGPKDRSLLGRMMREGGKRVGLIDFSDDAKRALFGVINDAMKEGYGPVQVAKMIEQYVPAGRFVNAGSKYRASLIARTEILQAQGRTSLDRYRNSDQVVAVVAFDGDYDPDCAERNGQEYTFDQAAEELGNTHPNCVLTFGPVTK